MSIAKMRAKLTFLIVKTTTKFAGESFLVCLLCVVTVGKYHKKISKLAVSYLLRLLLKRLRSVFDLVTMKSPTFSLCVF